MYLEKSPVITWTIVHKRSIIQGQGFIIPGKTDYRQFLNPASPSVWWRQKPWIHPGSRACRNTWAPSWREPWWREGRCRVGGPLSSWWSLAGSIWDGGSRGRGWLSMRYTLVKANSKCIIRGKRNCNTKIKMLTWETLKSTIHLLKKVFMSTQKRG